MRYWLCIDRSAVTRCPCRCSCRVSGCSWCSRFLTVTWFWSWLRPTVTVPVSMDPSCWSPKRSNISFTDQCSTTVPPAGHKQPEALQWGQNYSVTSYLDRLLVFCTIAAVKMLPVFIITSCLSCDLTTNEEGRLTVCPMRFFSDEEEFWCHHWNTGKVLWLIKVFKGSWAFALSSQCCVFLNDSEHNATVKCNRMKSQKVRRRPESCHAYHPKEDAKECGGAAAVSLSLSLFSASLLVSSLLHRWT